MALAIVQTSMPQIEHFRVLVQDPFPAGPGIDGLREGGASFLGVMGQFGRVRRLSCSPASAPEGVSR